MRYELSGLSCLICKHQHDMIITQLDIQLERDDVPGIDASTWLYLRVAEQGSRPVPEQLSLTRENMEGILPQSATIT
jgi:hypothetical protein